jgi:hypothetical protein
MVLKTFVGEEDRTDYLIARLVDMWVHLHPTINRNELTEKISNLLKENV